MPKSNNTIVKRTTFTVSISIALRDRLRALSKGSGIKTSTLIDEAVMDLLSKYAKKGGIMMMNEDQAPRETKHVICVANHKGGVGKTTTAAALAYLFEKIDNYRVLLIDADSQVNLSQTMKVAMDGRRDIMNAIIAKIVNAPVTIDSFILPTQYKNIDMIPGNLRIEGEDFMTKVRSAKMEEGINPWEEIVESVKALKQYDIILLDLHPSVGLDTLLPLQACDDVIVPLEPDERSVAGLSQVYQSILKSRRKMNPNIKLLGYFFNKVKSNTSSTKDYIPSARESIPKGIAALNGGVPEGICFETTIRDSEDVRKSINYHSAVTERFHSKKISQDFEKLYAEIKEALDRE